MKKRPEETLLAILVLDMLTSGATVDTTRAIIKQWHNSHKHNNKNNTNTVTAKWEEEELKGFYETNRSIIKVTMMIIVRT